MSVWGSSSTNIWTIGAFWDFRNGSYHYDGNNWTQVPTGVSVALWDIWGTGPSNVYAVGELGTVLRYNGAQWTTQSNIPTNESLNAIWGSSATDIFAVGDCGTVIHFDGTSWTAQASGATQNLYGVWGFSGSSVYAVGALGTIVHYDGTSWTPETSPTSLTLNDVAGAGNTVRAVGEQGTILAKTENDCVGSLTPSAASFSGVGGTGQCSVTAPDTCSWSALSNDSWIGVTSGSHGTGNGMVNFSVGPNQEASSRIGSLTIAGQTFRVDQAAPTPTPTPAVTTNQATNVASFSAALNGSVNPRGSTTTVYFQYGLTTGYGSATPVQTQNGNTVRAITANISGLAASTTYHFRIVAHNGGGTAFGSDRTFTTLTATGAPFVTTNPATLIGSVSATLNGLVYPHGLTTIVYFQYGTTTSYGSTTPSQPKSGNTYQNISANISGLTANTTYHFRIVATNSAGTRYGSDRTFTTLSATGPPVAITNPATLIASFSATLNGSVDPHGLTTTVYFQYGTTTSYGLTTANRSKTGSTYQSVSANISGLAASTTYHFRIVATNSSGTTYGADRTFTTLSATGPPVAITNPATNVTSSSATLNASVDPHGLTTTVSFQYGTTTSYGLTTANQSKAGNTYQNVAANISGLTASTTYHFRIVATNSSGTTYGTDRTFTTTP
jgi:hypothetical protein